MASGSGGRGGKGGGGRRGRGTKLKNNTAALNRRLNGNSYMSMNRGNRVRGQRNATVQSSAFLPF